MTILESFSMNVWIARLIACLVVGICGVLTYRFEKSKRKILWNYIILLKNLRIMLY